MSFSGSILKDQPPWPSDSHWNLAIQTAANYANCEGLVLQSSLGLSVCTWPVDGSRGHGVPKMLTQTNWIWSRANGPHFPSAQQIPHGNYLRSSTISNKHVIEPERGKKSVPIPETWRWETDSTGGATRPCKVLEDLSHYFKAEHYTLIIIFFSKSPNTKNSSSQQK